nr:MAG TPA: hypothetical protein [Caudoviricetes sp.]
MKNWKKREKTKGRANGSFLFFLAGMGRGYSLWPTCPKAK